MGQYQDISIKDLVEGMNDLYFLPDIQREFVWDTDKNKFEDKIYDLFDSLMRGYPIGTLLFWKVDHDRLKEDNISVLKFINKLNEDNDTIPLDNFKEKNITLVLDGQQRMTILNLAFRGVFEDKYRGKKKKKYLYFNLISHDNGSKEINERLYEFKLLESNETYFKDNDNKIWHRVSSLLNQPDSLTGYWEKIATETKTTGKEKNRILDNLSNFWKIITDKNISYYEIEKDKKDEEALEIFVRVNSGGVTLTYSDILFSKIKQYWKKGEEKIDAREEFKDFLKTINLDDFNFDNDFILKTSLVLMNTDIKYQIKNFNKDNVNLIKSKWVEIKNSINVVIEFLKNINITSKKYLGSNTAIIPMIYYAYKNSLKEIDNTSKNFDIMRKYIYAVLLNGVFGGQTDSLLKDSRDIIRNNKLKLFPIEDIFKSFIKKNRIIRGGEELGDLLNEVRYGSEKCKLILRIIYGSSLSKGFQEDHMYSQSRMLKKFDKSLVNNVANIQPLGFVNQTKGDQPFEDWLKEPNRSEDYMKMHLVPKMQNYSDDKFEEFIQKRKELILKKVKGFFD